MNTIPFIILALIILSVFCVHYAFNIEPYKLKSEHLKLGNMNSNQYLRVVQFSDTHLRKNFSVENLDRVVNLINEQNADIVVFTGDLLDRYDYLSSKEDIIASLGKINAKIGKFAIYGNRDFFNGYADIMKNSNFTVLKNQSKTLKINDDKSVLIIGVDDTYVGNPQIPDFERQDYNILLTHEPDSVDNFKDVDFDLALSGHSHGGQINIPFIPKINEMATSITEYANKYNKGLYDLSDKQKLYVNTGIGTTHIYARFGVTPKISVIDIFM